MWGFLLALLSGALMSVQGVLNTEATKQSSIWVTAGFVQISAFLICGIAWYVSGREPVGALLTIQPRYLLLGGVIGAFITITVVKATASLGPAQAAMVIVVSQIVVSYLIELFGLFGMEKAGLEWRKAIGAAIAIGGILLFQWES